ncbi:MAG: YmdB family metallophosphoesterase, partial [Candidatus Methylomirabilales bacterium]
MRILFLGEIIGKPGRQAIAERLPGLIQEYRVDLVLANAENAAGGFGITAAVAEGLFTLGIDLLTSGNHIFDQKEAEGSLSKEQRILRPANYPEGVPGFGSALLERNGVLVGVVNLQGRVFMPPLDCPFQVGQREVERLRQKTPIIIVDLHAEATAEKLAFAWH